MAVKRGYEMIGRSALDILETTDTHQHVVRVELCDDTMESPVVGISATR